MDTMCVDGDKVEAGYADAAEVPIGKLRIGVMIHYHVQKATVNPSFSARKTAARKVHKRKMNSHDTH